MTGAIVGFIVMTILFMGLLFALYRLAELNMSEAAANIFLPPAFFLLSLLMSVTLMSGLAENVVNFTTLEFVLSIIVWAVVVFGLTRFALIKTEDWI